MTVGQEEGYRRFPALDPEPPPRPWWLRLAPVAGLLAAGGVAAAALLVPGGAPARVRRPAAPPALLSGGRILAVLPGGALATTDPGGGGVHRLAGLSVTGTGWLAPSADGRYLVDNYGEIIGLSGGRPAPARAGQLPDRQEPAAEGPLADHDQALVVRGGNQYGGFGGASDPVSLLLLGSGRRVALGAAHLAAGDPQGLGAFVSVAASAPAETGVVASLPDARVELRQAGRPPVLLATAARLLGDLNADPKTPVTLIPYPSPSGNLIAVEVAGLAGTQSEGVVVLDRSGKVQASSPPGMGPLRGAPLAWSPSGGSLAYPTVGPNSPEIAVLGAAGSISEQNVPEPGLRLGGCMWSPDGGTVLCTAAGAAGPEWVAAGAAGGPVFLIRAPGTAVAWLRSAS